MSIILSIFNQKGGVGKTTSVYQVSNILADKGYKILMIDLDPQMSLTVNCGILNIDIPNMYDVLMKTITLDEIILNINENLDLAPSNLDLSNSELSLVIAQNREYQLKKHIETLKNKYDFIIIDTPPTRGILSINSLASSDYILVPVETDFLALKSIELVENTIQNIIDENVNSNLKNLGIILTKIDIRTSHSKEISNFIREKYNVIGEISQAVIVKNSAIESKPLIKLDEKHKVSKEYIELTNNILKEVL